MSEKKQDIIVCSFRNLPLKDTTVFHHVTKRSRLSGVGMDLYLKILLSTGDRAVRSANRTASSRLQLEKPSRGQACVSIYGALL